MRYALINEENVVVNVIELTADSKYKIPKGHKVMQSPAAGIGDLFDPETYTFNKPNI